ncbi:hypothetical protein GALMADRAFT_148698 [Galerina marginata CBS 339.88]|uniref:Uncharacterized protein n=1 Tax=Galerina marginata (strain CBS 339.88) TaxID=685588 RepID=A0A067S3R3_GALM3|nr:hypothetical protein GALMADRAFT_148698 [Galerina marginata CBS 339.88]
MASCPSDFQPPPPSLSRPSVPHHLKYYWTFASRRTRMHPLPRRKPPHTSYGLWADVCCGDWIRGETEPKGRPVKWETHEPRAHSSNEPSSSTLLAASAHYPLRPPTPTPHPPPTSTPRSDAE